MLSQTINPSTSSSTNQQTINNQQENFITLSLSTPINTRSSSSLQSKDNHKNHQLNQNHNKFQQRQQSRWQEGQQHLWKPHQSRSLYQDRQHEHQHQHRNQNQRQQSNHWKDHQYHQQSITILSLIDNNQYHHHRHPGRGVDSTLRYHHHLVTKLLSPTLRKSMNFLLTVLLLNLIHRVPCTLASVNNPQPSGDGSGGNTNHHLIANPYHLNNIDNSYDKEVTLTSSSLGNLGDDFSLSSFTHSRPVLLSSSKVPVVSSSSLSQSYSPSTTTKATSSQKQLGSSSPKSSQLTSSSSLSSLSSPPSFSSLTQPPPPSPGTESTSSPVSPGSYYSFISSHHPNQLSHYYLQINKPQQSHQPSTPSPPPPPPPSPTTTSTPQQSKYNNNNPNEIKVKTPQDFENLFHRIARRSSRPYDVPQIECPLSEDGVDRFACPTPNKEGRYRCIEDHELCNGFIACPNAEDEDRKLCMFYKTTKAHLDVLADAMLRMVRGRF